MIRWSLGTAAAPLASYLILVAVRPAMLAAQVEIAPFIGAFVPLGGGWTQDIGAGPVGRRNIAAHMVGGRVAYWTSPRLGVELTLGFTPSQTALSNMAGVRDIGGSLLQSSVRVLTRLVTLTDGNPSLGFTSWDITAGLGIGVIARQGSAWSDLTGTTHPAAVLALDIGTEISKAVTIRLGLEDFVSWAVFDRGLPGETGARVQHDFAVILAPQIRLGGRKSAR